MQIELVRVTPEDAALMLAGDSPATRNVAPDYPTEFSQGIAAAAANASPLGPFFMARTTDGIVVGEIGGGMTEERGAEIGYAVVQSCWGRGYATDAVRALIELATCLDGIDRLIAKTPLDRPNSGRVVEKAGFEYVGDEDDTDDGVTMRVRRWELALHA
jgi:RimJ/RimL family protein N-acetyltransferase